MTQENASKMTQWISA